jgi:cytochrome c
MKNANIVWTVETLDAFLQAPMGYVAGTSMGFAGIPDPQERLDLIAWLATLNAASSLCTAD